MVALVNGKDITVEEKHPVEKIRLPLDWTDFADGATITNSEWIVANVESGVTLSGEQVDGLVTSVLVSDGIVGQNAFVENRVTYNDGRLAVYTFCLPICTKVPTV